MPRHRARKLNAHCWISSIRSTNSIRRPHSLRRSSITSGRRSRMTSNSKAGRSRMREQPRKRPGRNIGLSLSAECGSVSSSEIGEKNNIKVTDDQLTQAIVSQARMMPGQEQRVWEYYRNNPAALAAVRAPLFEDKVIDFLLELANVTEKQVSREELFKEDED